jgi:hypothetical protein
MIRKFTRRREAQQRRRFLGGGRGQVQGRKNLECCNPILTITPLAVKYPPRPSQGCKQQQEPAGQPPAEADSFEAACSNCPQVSFESANRHAGDILMPQSNMEAFADRYSGLSETLTRLRPTLTRQMRPGQWVVFGGNALFHHNRRTLRCAVQCSESRFRFLCSPF